MTTLIPYSALRSTEQTIAMQFIVSPKKLRNTLEDFVDQTMESVVEYHRGRRRIKLDREFNPRQFDLRSHRITITGNRFDDFLTKYFQITNHYVDEYIRYNDHRTVSGLERIVKEHLMEILNSKESLDTSLYSIGLYQKDEHPYYVKFSELPDYLKDSQVGEVNKVGDLHYTMLFIRGHEFKEASWYPVVEKEVPTTSYDCDAIMMVMAKNKDDLKVKLTKAFDIEENSQNGLSDYKSRDDFSRFQYEALNKFVSYMQGSKTPVVGTIDFSDAIKKAVDEEVHSNKYLQWNDRSIAKIQSTVERFAKLFNNSAERWSKFIDGKNSSSGSDLLKNLAVQANLFEKDQYFERSLDKSQDDGVRSVADRI